MRKILFISILVSHGTIIFGQSPGGVSGNLIWWVKANTEVFEDNASADPAEAGDGVWVWDDQAAGDIDAINATAGTRPIYRTGVINNNPALEFDGTKFLDGEAVSGILGTESFHMFLVFKQNSYQTTGGPNDGNGTFIIDRPTATFNLTSFKVVNTDKYFYQRRYDDNSNLGGPVSVTAVNTTSFVMAEYFRIWVSAASATEGIYLDGRSDISQAGPTGIMTGPAIRIGNHATNPTGGLNGYFAEMVIYNTAPSTADRRRVESYLAIKYGISLNQSTLTDYVRSDGTVIYPAASTASYSSYVTNIAGIGQDNTSALDQTDSKSQNANSVVRVYNPTNLGNNEFFVWGSNNGSLTIPNTADVGGSIQRRLSRVWRVAETGNVGIVTMEFDLSAVPGAKVQADLRLLIDRDGDGFFDNDRTPLSGTLAGNLFTITVAAANINNGDYFTIGTTNTSTTPLPIDLLDFDVTYENPVVVASWKTASELNNEYFSLERAGTDLAFEELAKIPGAGTSKISHSYSSIDRYPYEGISYYRIKQTDFDGTATYTDPKYMFIEETKKQLSVFPNPSEGKVLHFSWGNSPFNLSQVEIISQQGKTIETIKIEKGNLREYSVEIKQRLSPGLYIVKSHYNGKDEFIKLVVR